MSTEQHFKQNYIGGRWVDSKGGKDHQVINPATEEPASTIVLGTAADVDDAVAAAKEAFKSWSQTTREQRLEVLNRIVEEYKKRGADLARSMAAERGDRTRTRARVCKYALKSAGAEQSKKK